MFLISYLFRHIFSFGPRSRHVWAHLTVARMSSDLLPARFAFDRVRVAMLGRPLLAVRRLRMSRDGLADTSMRALAASRACANAARALVSNTSGSGGGEGGGSNGMETETIGEGGSDNASVGASVSAAVRARIMALEDRNASVDLMWDERALLLADHLPLVLGASGVHFEIPSGVDVGTLIHAMIEPVDALIAAYHALPKLDRLSRRLGGPGYLGRPVIPDPAVRLRAADIAFELLDEPLEAFLTNMAPVWRVERGRHLQWEECLRLKLRTWNVTSAGAAPPSAATVLGSTESTVADLDAQSAQNLAMGVDVNELAREFGGANFGIGSGSGSRNGMEGGIGNVGGGSGDCTDQSLRSDVSHWWASLRRMASDRFVAHARSLRNTTRLARGALLCARIATFDVTVGYAGEFGNFHDRASMVGAIRALDASCADGGATFKSTAGATASSNQADSRDRVVCPRLDARKCLESAPLMLGSYVGMQIRGIELNVRDFSRAVGGASAGEAVTPLVKVACVEMSGSSVIAQWPTDAQNSRLVAVPLSSGFGTLRAEQNQPRSQPSRPMQTHLNSHQSSSSHASARGGGMSAAEPPYHVVMIRRQFSPFQMYYSFDGKVTGVHVACAPGALPAAVLDLGRAVCRLAPGFLDARIRPMLDVWDIARWLAHGRLRMEVADICVHASVAASRADSLPFGGGGSLRHYHGGAASSSSPLSAASPASASSAEHHDASGSNPYNSVSLSVARVKIAYENSVIRVSTLRTDVAIGNALPRSAAAGPAAAAATVAPFMTLPRVDVAVGLHWQSGSGRPDMHTVYPIGSIADNDDDNDSAGESVSAVNPARSAPLLPGDYQNAVSAAARRALIDFDAIQRDCAQPRWMARLWSAPSSTSAAMPPPPRRLEMEDGAALPIEARMFWAHSDAEFARHFHSRAHATIENRWYAFDLLESFLIVIESSSRTILDTSHAEYFCL